MGQPVQFDGSDSQPGPDIVNYNWTFGDGLNGSGAIVTHAYAQPGVFSATLTVTDENGATSSDIAEVTIVPAVASSNVAWASLVNATAYANSLRKGVSTVEAWDSGAISQRQVLSGDGYVDFTITSQGLRLVAGLGYADTGTSPEDVEFGIQAQGLTAQAYELGVGIGPSFIVEPGDRLRVSLDSGVVRYAKNGRLLREAGVLRHTGTAALPAETILGWSLAGVVDVDANGGSDLLWRNGTSGSVRAWLMNGITQAATLDLGAEPDADWAIAGCGDFNGDGRGDVLWHHRTIGSVRAWLLDGAAAPTSQDIGTEADLNWVAVGTGDLDGDGDADILWRHLTSGALRAWLMNGIAQVGSSDLPTESDLSWSLVGLADINADGWLDILWRNSLMDTRAWYMRGTDLLAATPVLLAQRKPGWTVAGVGDLNADGMADLLWRNVSSGANDLWYLSGAPVYPLTADAALWSPGALVAQAVMGGSPNVPPVAHAGGSYLWTAGEAIRLDGSASVDPDTPQLAQYAWDFGDGTHGTGVRPSHVYATAGTFTAVLVVTDEDGATASDSASVIVRPALTPQAVAWAYPVSVEVYDNTLVKVGGDGWNAGASAHQWLESGDGYVEFLGGPAGHRMAGLGTGDDSAHYSDIEFALHLVPDGSLRVFEAGVLKGTVGRHGEGDRLRVFVDKGSVFYVQNGRILASGGSAPVYPLRLDTSLFTPGSSLSGAAAAGTDIQVHNQPPTVVASSSGNCHVPCPVTFAATASDPEGDPLVTWGWLGCAEGQSGQTATCQMTNAGTVTASVFVTDSLGATGSATVSAQGTNLPPIAALTGDDHCHPACTMNFVASGSDPDGDTLTFTWGNCAAGQTGPAASCSFVNMSSGGTVPVSVPVLSWVQTTFGVLNGHYAGCNGPSAIGSSACRTATERFCRAQPGYSGGFGPVEYAGTSAWVRCVGAGSGEESPTTWATLAGHHSGCSGSAAANSSACDAASHRYCVALGFGSGFGPVEFSATAATPFCFGSNSTRLLQATFAQLQARDPGCLATDPASPACRAAANRFCAASGYAGGFGPVESTATSATLACLPSASAQASATVSVVATDPSGASGSAQKQVLLQNLRPDVSVAVSGSGCHVPCSATFTAIAVDLDADALAYSWSGCAAGQGGPVATCAMDFSGDVEATVVVTDALGATATASGSAHGSNAVPSVSIAGDTVCHPPCIAQLHATASDPDGDAVGLFWAGCSVGQTGPDATCSLPAVPSDGTAPTQQPAARPVETTFAELSNHYAGCGPFNVGSGACRIAANRFCGSQSQYSGGLAPVEWDTNPGNAKVVCFGEELSDEVQTTYTILHSYWDACVLGALNSPACKGAVNAFCVDHGYGAGVGPLEAADDDVVVVCTAAVVSHVLAATFVQLDGYHPGCAYTAGAANDCRIAMNRYCRAHGYGGGFGPTAAGNGVAQFYCLPSEVGFGSVDVAVLADDGRGGTSTATAVVQGINGWPGGLTIDVAPVVCTAPCSVTFTAAASDPDGDTLAFSWSGCALGQAGASATCHAAQAGAVHASVTASDGRGGSVTGDAQATAQAAAQNVAPVSKPGGPYRAVAGRPVTLDGRASYDSDGTITQAAWNFGDQSSGGGLLAVHAYSGPGTYTAWLGVWDDDGASHAAPATVVVVAEDDPDGDGLTNAQEQALGSNPNSPDTNADGIPDGAALTLGLSLTDTDMDDDTIANSTEIAAGTNPFAADTDADGHNDAQDAFPLDPTRWSATPAPGDTTPPAISLERPEGATPLP